MPEHSMPHGNTETWRSLDAFTQGYWEAAFFTEQTTICHLTFADVSVQAWKQAVGDCRLFQTKNAALLARAYGRPKTHGEGAYDEAAAGRDFWYTRNGHGVGFWDRDELDGLGDELTAACDRQSIDLYVSGDKIYFG